jgi:non-specific serine/threonine protein kinase
MGKVYRYRIGAGSNAIRYDESRLELEVGGLRVDIQPKPLQIFSALLAKAGEIVTREELFTDIWLGRPTVDNVIPNAVSKLRNALGPENSRLIENVPRVGYRFTGRFERISVGQEVASRLDLAAGREVPHRPGYILLRLLGRSNAYEAWLAVGGRSDDLRVFKFAADAPQLSGLKREATLSRLLQDRLGDRGDMVRVLDWRFDSPPFFLESGYGGQNLAQWQAGGGLRSLDEPARLELFLQIAAAVAAAHSVGVLHKDLKPGNVLISRGEHGWRVRLSDFGSGRLLDPDRLRQLGITALGMTMADGIGSDAARGTLMYAAPELLRGQPATIRSDVYSLGVLLYQTVIGDFEKFLIPGWEREIADDMLRDDIARATDGDPEVRTGNVDALIHNLRHLEARHAERVTERSRELQLARVQTELERIRARRPWAMATILSLLVGLAVSLNYYLEARRAKVRVAAENSTVTALNRFLTEDLIAAADPSIAGRSDVTVIEAAKKAAAGIDPRFPDDPGIRASLHAAMQQTFDGLADYHSALAQGDAALRSLAAVADADPQRLAGIHLTMAMDLAETSELTQSAAEVDKALALLGTTDLEGTVLGARVWLARARIASIALELPAALNDYRRAWAALERSTNAPNALAEQVEFQYADANKMLFHFDEAASQFRDLLMRQTARYGGRHPLPCYTQLALANTLGYTKRSAEAMPLAEAATACLAASLGPSNVRTVTAHDVLGGLYFLQDRYREAAVEWQLVGDQFAKTQGAGSLRALNLDMNLALARQYSGDIATAESLFAATLGAARVNLKETHPLVQTLRYHLADCRLDLHRTDEVANLLAGLSADALARNQMNPDWDARLAYQEGRLALQLGDRARAVPLLEGAARIIAAKNPQGRISEAVIRKLLGEAVRAPLTHGQGA